MLRSLVFFEQAKPVSPMKSALTEFWQYKDVLYFLVWRNIKVRYKQTLLGISWAIIQPFMMMVVFTIFLGKFAGMPSAEIAYRLFTYSALVPWMYFSVTLGTTGNSLVFPLVMLTPGVGMQPGLGRGRYYLLWSHVSPCYK